ncbi:OmpH family outer membrane protein [Planctomicrobium sp. SH661]|uniref:OmpH family outer membrane protein n=1 Tax=Planctomicrobium sp. SH661 TaxID=3448124 RepID=UPI003F5B6CD2
MKKYSLLAVALATVGLFGASQMAIAQDAAPAPHQIGLIDMAHIFKNYDKFKDQTAGLQKLAEEAEAKAQAMMEEGKKGQEQLQTLTPGSPEFSQIEAKLIKLKTELETFRQVEQQKIVRQQADVYKTIYLEVQDVVNRYAEYYKYTLVIRFNRGDVADAGNPQAIIQNMNRQVVYYKHQDDITDPILKHLNDQYKKTASK